MAKPSYFDASLYKLADTATVVTDGYAIQTSHDACLRIIDGEVKATKFGVYEIGPSTVRKVKEDASEAGLDLYDKINKETKIKFYFGTDYHYIPTNIDRVFTEENYAVYNTEDGQIYEVDYDTREQSTFNLFSKSERAVLKVDADELRGELGQQYKPLVRVNKTR